MKKKNIINGITARFDRLRKKVRSVFFALLQYIKDKLVQKEKVDSRISGTSSVKRKKSRKGSKINAEITREIASKSVSPFVVSCNSLTQLKKERKNSTVKAKDPVGNESQALCPEEPIDTSENENCEIILSKSNTEQTKDLRIGFHPCVKLENKNDYPMILLPKDGSFLKLPRQGRSDIRGYKEISFMELLQSSNLNIAIGNDKHLKIPGRTLPYEPDFVLYDKSMNLYIDVEIDEPYDGFSRIPMHTIDGSDDVRNLFFAESGWVVVRFTERQVHLNPSGCIDVLKYLMEYLQEGMSNVVLSINHEQRWDNCQATIWEHDLYREKYLGIQSFPQEQRNTKIICRDNEDVIDSEIERTPKYPPSQHTSEINSLKDNPTKVVFDDKIHIYRPKGEVTGNSDYISVTTLIDKFFPTFDESAFINNKMQETGRSYDEILKEIKEPAERGTQMHKQIELFLKGEKYDDSSKEFSLFHKFYNEQVIPRKLKFDEAELAVLLPENNIAGTIDALFKKSNGEFIMFDWKRSIHLIVDGYPKKYGYGRGLSVLSHLDNSSYYKYELQQSFYKYILEKEYGLHVSSMILVVLHPEYDDYYTIKLSDYRLKEVKQMIEINDRMMK